MAIDTKLFKLSLDLQVRFRDTDAMRHVNNAVYLSYLELARMCYWRRLTGLKNFGKVDMILARVEIDYRSPATLDDDLRIWVRIPELKRSSFGFEYYLEDKLSGRLIAEAKTVQACYDYATAKVCRIADDLRQKIVDFEAPHPVLFV